MKKAVVLVLLVFMLTVGLYAACDVTVKCPMHDTAGTYFTGNVRQEGGHMWHEYHCTGGGSGEHDFWVRCD